MDNSLRCPVLLLFRVHGKPGALFPSVSFHSIHQEPHMSILNTEIKPFKASAYKNGQFIELTEADVKGK